MNKRADRMTYISGLQDVIELKKKYPEFKTVLHSDHEYIYTSIAFNELLPHTTSSDLCPEQGHLLIMGQWNQSIAG